MAPGRRTCVSGRGPIPPVQTMPRHRSFPGGADHSTGSTRKKNRRVLTNGAELLEHFARLATNVAGTRATVVGVPGQRKGLQARRVAYGISRDELPVVDKIDAILSRGPDLTVIPDVTKDDRFDFLAVGFDPPRYRFVVYMKLIAPGGAHAGFICLLDETARPGLSEEQTVSLGHVAGMIMADRRREQRHRHLMHVADRALRLDRLLRLVSVSAPCAHSLTDLLDALCHF